MPDSEDPSDRLLRTERSMQTKATDDLLHVLLHEVTGDCSGAIVAVAFHKDKLNCDHVDIVREGPWVYDQAIIAVLRTAATILEQESV